MTTTNRPLVGRGPHLDRITRALHGRNSRGLVIAGPPGAGRTRLAAEVRPAWRIVATRCAAARPLAAFGGRSADEIRAAVRRGPEPRVLVIDDAHLLDAASASTLHHFALHREIRLVVTVVDGAPAPDAVTALWKDDLLGYLPLSPLNENELAEVLTAALGGPVERRTVRHLAVMVRGDLRMLAEIVRAGALTRRRGVWTWHGLAAVDGRIRELIAARFGDLDEAAWNALTYAAFAVEPLPPAAGAPTRGRDEAPLTSLDVAPPPLEMLASVAGEAAVELLETRGIVALDGSVPYAEVIRAMTGRIRACRIRRHLASLTDDPLRSALWRLGCGDPVNAGRLVAAAHRALDADEVPLALHLGRTAQSAGGGAAALEVIAAADRHTVRLDVEAARLDAALAAGDLSVAPMLGADTGWDEAAATYCGHQARLARLRGRPQTALAWARDGALRHPTPLCLGELAHAGALLGDLSSARTTLADLDGGPHREQCQAAGLALAQLLAADGDRDGALAAALSVRGAWRVFGLHDVVRLGRPELVAGDLERMPGAFAELAGRQAAALLARDGAVLEIVAKAFERLGYLLYAAESYAQAAAEHLRHGEQRRARAAVNHGWRLGRECEGARTPALIALAAPDLTRRQREIAQLAVTGLSNREIADRLTVSIRTVANHLCGVYDRLGVHNRAGLASLLAGLETE
jgi:DNA-binding CsgD family transcriptional regulator